MLPPQALYMQAIVEEKKLVNLLENGEKDAKEGGTTPIVNRAFL
jgi:hypothetical protein